MKYYSILVFYVGICFMLDCHNNFYLLIMIYYVYAIVIYSCTYVRNMVNILHEGVAIIADIGYVVVCAVNILTLVQIMQIALLRKSIFDLTSKYDRRKCTQFMERKYNNR